jgi:hypothetical protein
MAACRWSTLTGPTGTFAPTTQLTEIQGELSTTCGVQPPARIPALQPWPRAARRATRVGNDPVEVALRDLLRGRQRRRVQARMGLDEGMFCSPGPSF